MKTINSDIVNIKSGMNVLIYKPVNIYDCILGDNVFIGPFVEIQRGAKIGNNTRIQSHTFICEDVVIGNDCFIGHNVTFANDLFKNGSPCGDQGASTLCSLINQRTIEHDNRHSNLLSSVYFVGLAHRIHSA